MFTRTSPCKGSPTTGAHWQPKQWQKPGQRSRLAASDGEVWAKMIDAFNTAHVDKGVKIRMEIGRLWDEYRSAKVHARFGDRDAIIKRARLEERLERAA